MPHPASYSAARILAAVRRARREWPNDAGIFGDLLAAWQERQRRRDGIARRRNAPRVKPAWRVRRDALIAQRWAVLAPVKRSADPERLTWGKAIEGINRSLELNGHGVLSARAMLRVVRERLSGVC